MLVRKHGHPFKRGGEGASIHLDRTAEGFRQQLAIIGIGAIEAAAGEHLIGPEHHHLPPLTEQAQGLIGGAAGEEALQFPQGAGRHGDSEGLPPLGERGFAAGGDGILKALHGQAVAIGGGAFQAVFPQPEVHTGEQLFGLVRGTGEDGGA